jgi:hypothetical protein
MALKIVMRFWTASSSAECGANALPRGCTFTLSAVSGAVVGGLLERGSAIAVGDMIVKV